MDANPTRTTAAEARTYPASIAYMAQSGGILVTNPTPGRFTGEMTSLAASLRRAGARTGDQVSVTTLGSGSLLVTARKAA